MNLACDQPSVVISDRCPRVEDGSSSFAKRRKPPRIPFDWPRVERLDERFVVVIIGGGLATSQETAGLGEKVVHCGDEFIRAACALWAASVLEAEDTDKMCWAKWAGGTNEPIYIIDDDITSSKLYQYCRH